MSMPPITEEGAVPDLCANVIEGMRTSANPKGEDPPGGPPGGPPEDPPEDADSECDSDGSDGDGSMAGRGGRGGPRPQMPRWKRQQQRKRREKLLKLLRSLLTPDLWHKLGLPSLTSKDLEEWVNARVVTQGTVDNLSKVFAAVEKAVAKNVTSRGCVTGSTARNTAVRGKGIDLDMAFVAKNAMNICKAKHLFAADQRKNFDFSGMSKFDKYNRNGTHRMRVFTGIRKNDTSIDIALYSHARQLREQQALTSKVMAAQQNNPAASKLAIALKATGDAWQARAGDTAYARMPGLAVELAAIEATTQRAKHGHGRGGGRGELTPQLLKDGLRMMAQPNQSLSSKYATMGFPTKSESWKAMQVGAGGIADSIDLDE